MNPLEDELRNALRRKGAPEGFAETVLARTQSLPRLGANGWRQFRRYFALPVLRWAAVAAVCLLIVAGLVRHQRQDRVRREGEMARAQVTQALRIASAKLNVARRRVEEIGRESSPRRL
ncbi:MAG: hypothetical protein ACLQVL_08510 [Terriglobia bacterium]